MSEQKVLSPRINELHWGRMAIDGVGSGKDFKLWQGGGREWDWKIGRASCRERV